MSEIGFHDRTAVVTGGAGGIGIAIARRLAAGGARVALWDSDKVALEKASAALPQGALLHALDVADADAVANAGAGRGHQGAERMTDERNIVGHARRSLDDRAAAG